MIGKIFRATAAFAGLALGALLPASLLFRSKWAVAAAALSALLAYCVIWMIVQHLMDKRQRRP